MNISQPLPPLETAPAEEAASAGMEILGNDNLNERSLLRGHLCGGAHTVLREIAAHQGTPCSLVWKRLLGLPLVGVRSNATASFPMTQCFIGLEMPWDALV